MALILPKKEAQLLGFNVGDQVMIEFDLKNKKIIVERREKCSSKN